MFFMEAFKEGGWGMYPILIIAIISIYLSIDRWTYLARCKVDADRLDIADQSPRSSAAMSVAPSQPARPHLCRSPRSSQPGLMKSGGSEHDIQQAMDEEALRELPKVEKRTGYLAMLGNLATLAGLLGTITGLIKSFGAVAGVDPSMKATMLSKGYLRGHELHCLRVGYWYLRPCYVRRPQTAGRRASSTASTRARRGTQLGGRRPFRRRRSALVDSERGAETGPQDGSSIMSVSVQTGNKSGKKELNAELNLVPYIDLLTCMVAFLLITAVVDAARPPAGPAEGPGAKPARKLRPSCRSRSSSW